jgi:hypothetical protein
VGLPALADRSGRLIGAGRARECTNFTWFYTIFLRIVHNFFMIYTAFAILLRAFLGQSDAATWAGGFRVH